MTAIVSSRFEFRLPVDSKRLIERAAELVGVSASDFARSALEERAARVLREHFLVTVVPPEFFDDLLGALDTPAVPNPTLAAAARRADQLIQRR